MTPEDLKENLAQFIGTENYYRWSVLFPNFILTDGAKYLAEEAGAYWLMDLIASHRGAFHRDTFAVVKLKKREKDWLVVIEDGNDNEYARQVIEYSDFPLDDLTLYACLSEAGWVIMLPSEY